jgi:hypothetical protein
MAKVKSVIEQALLEAEQIDATFKANAKEILSQTMGSEIEEMVKESLKGSPMASNEEEDDDMEMATDLELGDDELDLELGDEDGMDDLDLGLDLGDEDGLEGDDMDVIDLTDSDDEELIKVFKGMDPDSEIEVVQDENGVSFTDTETGAEYKVELGGGEMGMDLDLEMGDMDMDDDMEYEDDEEEVIDLDAGDELEYEDDEDEDEEIVYEIEITEDDEDEVEDGGDSVKEAPRTMSKLKGRKYGNPKRRVESKRPSNNFKIVKENKVLKNNIDSLKAEKQGLVENQEKMVDALKQFRQKLQEVAVFNSNLAHVVRLFTENTTTKEEKVDIVKRMDEATTLKESKMMFKNIAKTLNGVKAKETIKESVNAKINKTASTGSSQITESKVFENPELAKMKKMWEFNYKY